MRSRLLKSFLFVLGFWWIATALYWSVLDPERNLDFLRQVLEAVPFYSHLRLPENVTILDGWAIQKQVLLLWCLPTLVLTAISTLIGTGLVWLNAYRKNTERDERVEPSEMYRGVQLTLGILPVPQLPPSQPVALRATNESLKQLREDELNLLNAILGLYQGNPNAFAGEGRPPGSLMQRVLRQVQLALKSTTHPGLSALAEAGAHLGKLVAWRQEESGGWVLFKREQAEAARIMAALPEWYALQETDRLALAFAVKYRDNPGALPEATRYPQSYQLAQSLLRTVPPEAPPAPVEAPAAAPIASAPAVAAEYHAARPRKDRPEPARPVPQHVPAPHRAVLEPNEHQQVFEAKDPAVELRELFERELETFTFQGWGLNKDTPAVGWKVGTRIYLLENQLKTVLRSRMRPDQKARWAAPAQRVRVEPMITTLLNIFFRERWLVTEHDGRSVEHSEALWKITAGIHKFSRVIVLELPETLRHKVPSKDSKYEVAITGPVFEPVSKHDFANDDMLAGLLRPSTKAPAPVAAEG